MMPRQYPKVATPPKGKSYQEYVFAYGYPYVEPSLSPEEFKRLIADAYKEFSDPSVEQLKDTPEGGLWLLDLSKGPSHAFKDFALQLLARLFMKLRNKRRLRVLVATSGDTGAAAVKALGGLDGIGLLVLHPKGLIAPLQRRQMTTDPSPNIRNIAIQGDFDQCQKMVKTLLQTEDFVGVNSINWARIVAQTAYYGWAAAQITTESPPSFVVPTGNFGNVLAGFVARKMGVAMGRLVMAVNANDPLVRLMEEGRLTKGKTLATLSPSMDIQAPSNFERILYEFCGKDKTTLLMEKFQATGELQMPADALAKLRSYFGAVTVNDTQTLATMADIYSKHRRFVDPHTAVGIAAARQLATEPPKPHSPPHSPPSNQASNQQPNNQPSQATFCCIATADAAKFPEAVERATGKMPPLPASLRQAQQGEEKYITLPADTAAVRAYIKGEGI